jgi:predicted PolB exonuclease-like 3'-5' exonuclease
MGTQSEAQLITGLANVVARLRPQLITFNGSGFDLPVLRYRAMLNRLSLPCFSARPYFHRYSPDAVDLCDVLSSFGASKRASLQEICRSLGFMGKANGLEGSQVEELVQAGRITDVADYCCSDVVNTYRIWLTYELFCGRLSAKGYTQSDKAALAA